MKTRSSFVANSSSSSFIIVGVQISDLPEEVIEKVVEGNSCYPSSPDPNLDIESTYADDELEERYLTLSNVAQRLHSKTINQLKEEFKDYMKEKYGVDVNPTFDYGGYYNG